jgi:hypothetical protein
MKEAGVAEPFSVTENTTEMLKNKQSLSFILMGALAVSAISTASAQTRRAPQPQNENQRAAGQRLAPPSALKCPRDHLTSFTGKVIAYQRTRARIMLRVRTDEATTESFTLKLAQNDDPAKWFLLRGEGFKPADWKSIEIARGRLRKSMRATVWVCDDGSKPVIDWRPPENN